MPVLKHFGLSDYPFALTPNTSLYLPWDQHKAILGSLQFALQRGDGLLKVVGEVGTGKTLLCRLLLSELVKTDNAGYLNAPIEDLSVLPMAVCREFGVDPKETGDPYSALTRFLIAEHAKGKRNILLVDEAQSLGRTGLEVIRLLSNLETETKKLLQIVLFGQVELNRELQHSSMRQVAQRINFSFETKPLSPDLVVRYIEHRVARCTPENVHRDLFEKQAMLVIAHASRGIPRLVNVLADKALLAAFGDNARQVRKKHAAAAVSDSAELGLKPQRFAWLRNLFGLRSAAA
jgi:MSHA biogenesis protein MshM